MRVLVRHLPDAVNPSIPTGLTLAATSSTTINASWAMSTDAYSGVDKYKIYLSSGVLVGTVTAPVVLITLIGLTANTSYTYYVTAIDKEGNESLGSEAATITTPALPVSGFVNPLSISPYAWYNIENIGSLWQDTAATIPVTANEQVIARINNLAGVTANLTQATNSARPLYRAISSILGLSACTSHFISFDLVNDSLIWTGNSGTYYIAMSTISTVTFFPILLTNNSVFQASQFIDCVVRTTDYTTQERADLTEYFLTKRGGIPVVDLLFICTTTSFTGRGGECLAPVWKFGGGTVYNTMFTTVQTTTPLEVITFDTANINLVNFDISYNSLTGVLKDLSAHTNLNTFYAGGNKLTGNIPVFPPSVTEVDLSNNMIRGTFPALTENILMFSCANNYITGSIASMGTVIETLIVNNNYMSGTIPALAPSLVEFVGNNNSFSGVVPPLTPAGLTRFIANDNDLVTFNTGSSLSLKLYEIKLQNNLLTEASVDNILAAVLTLVTNGGPRIGSVDVSGTGNVIPSAAGLASKASIASAAPGWIVATN